MKGSVRLLSVGLVKSLPLIFFAAIGFGIFWGIRENLYADPGFLVQSLKIVPETGLSEERVRELERLYLNRNLFKISPREVAEVVERDPKIRQTRVVREFPATLRIEIRDRTPFAEIQLSPKSDWYAVAEDGVVLSWDKTRNKNLLLIEAFVEGVSKLRERGEVNLRGFEQAVTLVKAFGNSPLSHSETIDRVRLDHLGNVNLVLAQGPELRFGREPMKKLGTLDSLGPLLKGPERERIVYIELQYDDLIVKKK